MWWLRAEFASLWWRGFLTWTDFEQEGAKGTEGEGILSADCADFADQNCSCEALEQFFLITDGHG